MTLDRQAEAWLKGIAELGAPPLNEMSVVDARDTYTAVVAQCGPAPEPVADIVDRTVPGPQGEIPVRIYTPRGSGPFPILVYFHGGGWVIGNLEVVHGLCTVLANRAHCVVVSVDYRLAPEHVFPAAVDDCFAATRWAADSAALLGGDPERVAVGGDSAGGTLAAVVAAMARDEGGPALVYQLLIYPATDVDPGTRSYRENGEGYFLTRELMAWFYDHYLDGEAQKKDWRASPLRISSTVGLPPALVITGEYDPLRDEGEAYAARLIEGGVPVTCRRYLGQIHAFTANLSGVMDQGKASMEHAGRQLRQAFRAGWEPRMW